MKKNFQRSTFNFCASIVARIANPGTLSERIGNPRYDGLLAGIGSMICRCSSVSLSSKPSAGT